MKEKGQIQWRWERSYPSNYKDVPQWAWRIRDHFEWEERGSSPETTQGQLGRWSLGIHQPSRWRVCDQRSIELIALPRWRNLWKRVSGGTDKCSKGKVQKTRNLNDGGSRIGIFTTWIVRICKPMMVDKAINCWKKLIANVGFFFYNWKMLSFFKEDASDLKLISFSFSISS